MYFRCHQHSFSCIEHSQGHYTFILVFFTTKMKMVHFDL